MTSKSKQYYFRFRICWYRCLQKAEVYKLTKFRRHISVDGWDITTSVFKEQTSAILEIYFRFRFRPSAHYSASGYRTLSKSKHPLLKYDVISISQDGGRDGSILLPVSYMLMSLPSEGQSLLANQILSRYLKWKLRYIFLWQSKMAWEGVKIFFQNQECVNILGCSVTFCEYKNIFLMLVDNVRTIQALFVTKPLL